MALIRWQPWQEMESLRRQLDRVFDDLVPTTRDGLTTSTRTWAPAIELKATETDLVLRAELPGIKADDLDVQVTAEAVLISGEYRSETKTEENHGFRSEFRYGSFRRVVPLPVAVQNDRVNAEFDNGILTLTLPKVEAPKAVKINLAGTATEPALEPNHTEPAQEAAVTEQAETGDVWATQS